ncbi:MAG: ABC transporter ATP-binding protein [Anaerolineae bacterium]
MLQVERLVVRFGDLVAVDGADLRVADGQVVCVLGPSGCGKTTLLRAVAGLEPPVSGRVLWDGQDLSSVPPHERGFGLMFQEYMLFPHKDVVGNVAFGLRMAEMDRDRIEARVEEVLTMVGLEGHGDRSVAHLSGGEQQRVALARALAPAPKLLMLDEPIGALDRTLRERLMVELRDLFAQLRITTLYVTHDQEEAFAVADRVAVMRAGHVEQEGSAEEVWRRPANEFVARFLGFETIVKASIADGAAMTVWGPIPVPRSVPAGRRRLVIRPEAFSPDPHGVVAGDVESRTFRGDHFLLRIRPDTGPTFEAAVRGDPVPAVGDRVRLRVDPDEVVVLD